MAAEDGPHQARSNKWSKHYLSRRSPSITSYWHRVLLHALPKPTCMQHKHDPNFGCLRLLPADAPLQSTCGSSQCSFLPKPLPCLQMRLSIECHAVLMRLTSCTLGVQLRQHHNIQHPTVESNSRSRCLIETFRFKSNRFKDQNFPHDVAIYGG